MVVGYSDVNDGCTYGSADRVTGSEYKEDDLKIVPSRCGAVTDETVTALDDVTPKILDICRRTTSDKGRIVETTVDVVSSSDESTAEYSSSEEDNNALESVGKNMDNQMVNKVNHCKDFLVAKNVQIINNYPQQPLDVEQLKYITDGKNSSKSLWVDGVHPDESIERVHKKVSHPFSKAVAVGVTVTLVLVVVVVGLELGQLKASEPADNPGSQCAELVTRSNWGAMEPKKRPHELTTIPPEIVIVAHTDGPTCSTSSECREIVKNIQISAVSLGAFDIPFNFLVGGDCKIYEGLGWNKTGNHTILFNNRSIGLAFVGSFMTLRPSQAQVDVGLTWLEDGVKSGNLDPEYVVYVQKQVTPYESPGVQMIPFIKRWPHWSDNVTVTDII